MMESFDSENFPMLPLDSPIWATLQHAYGNASDIPQLLRELEKFPPSNGNAEPWFSIWSALAHQGDVYSASFAAVPHVIRALSIAPDKAPYVYFDFPAWVEICRQRKKVIVPEALSFAYFQSHRMLPQLVCAAASKDWNEDFLRATLSALAVGKGFAVVAEVAQELNQEVASEFLEWFHGR
jgi:hypothetical protein